MLYWAGWSIEERIHVKWLSQCWAHSKEAISFRHYHCFLSMEGSVPSFSLGTPTNRGKEDSVSSVPKGAAGRGTKSRLYENWALPGKLGKVNRDGRAGPSDSW